MNRNPVLVTMAGPRDLPDISRMSNFEAGIATLVMLDKVYPGIRWRDLPALADGYQPEAMAGWWTSLKKAVGDVKDGVGDVLKSTGDYVGSAFGSTVRLATDEKVIDGASRIGTAYATNGGSEGVRQLFGGSGESGSPFDAVMSFISGLGEKAKSANIQAAGVGGMSPAILPWALGGGLLLVLLMGRR